MKRYTTEKPACKSSSFVLQEKRSDREIENLFSIIENATEINDNQVNRVVELSNTYVPTLIEKLNEAFDETSPIFQLEKDKLQVIVIEIYIRICKCICSNADFHFIGYNFGEKERK